MDLKNLFNQLSPLLNLFNNQNNNLTNSKKFAQNEWDNSANDKQNICLYPKDFSSTLEPNNNGENLQNTGIGNYNNINNQQQSLSTLLPLLGIIFNGKNNFLTQLLSKNNQENLNNLGNLGNIGQILQLFTKTDEKQKLPNIDSYKKIE